jgi:hypothetical protein
VTDPSEKILSVDKVSRNRGGVRLYPVRHFIAEGELGCHRLEPYFSNPINRCQLDGHPRNWPKMGGDQGTRLMEKEWPSAKNSYPAPSTSMQRPTIGSHGLPCNPLRKERKRASPRNRWWTHRRTKVDTGILNTQRAHR